MQIRRPLAHLFDVVAQGRLHDSPVLTRPYQEMTNHWTLESSVSDYLLLFCLRGRPPLRPLFLAALALAADRARPPFVPPVLPQFLNISITALGSSARRVLLGRFAIPSGF